MMANSLAIQLIGGEKLQVYAIPGQNGLGSEPAYIKEVLKTDRIVTRKVMTPDGIDVDLGQEKCINYLRAKINETDSKSQMSILLYATSQGTATALNYLAHEPVIEGQRKSAILEACLGSGNSAILHTMKGPLMNIPIVPYLPLAHYWIPYCAKFIFPFYSPSGMQAIKSIEKIKHQGPFVIIHSNNDPQLAFSDACAVYYGLRKNNNSTYFIEKDGSDHIRILEDSKPDQMLVRAILKKEGLLIDDEIDKLSDEACKVYQPDHNQDKFKKPYIELRRKEMGHVTLKYSVLLSGAYSATRMLAPYFSK